MKNRTFIVVSFIRLTLFKFLYYPINKSLEFCWYENVYQVDLVEPPTAYPLREVSEEDTR